MNETCGCCEGTQKLTPITIYNRPGLNALTYRLGTHASFLETMKANLSNFSLEVLLEELDEQGKPRKQTIYPLKDLTTRVEFDPAIALLDAWATVADVLTFYQERIANEGYLRTATERFSILELAQLVGYVLRPGVSASVYLAYTLEDGHNVVILPGNRAQSLPGPGELPQSFETAEKLEARFAWNALKPRLARPQLIKLTEPTNSNDITTSTVNTDRLYLQGTATRLSPGDPLVFLFDDTVDATKQPPVQHHGAFYRVATVDPQPAQDRTLVTLQPISADQKLAALRIAAIKPLPPANGNGKADFKEVVKSLSQPPSVQPANSQRLQRSVTQVFTPQSDIHPQLLKTVNPALKSTLDAALSNADVVPLSPSKQQDVLALRVKAALFGHDVTPEILGGTTGATVTLERIVTPANLANILPRLLPLDAQYDQIEVGSWVVVEIPSIDMKNHTLRTTRIIRNVKNVQTITLSPIDILSLTRGAARSVLSALSIATKITLLTLDEPWLDDWLKEHQGPTTQDILLLLRATTIYAQSEVLPLADEPFVKEPTANQPVVSEEDAENIQGGDPVELDQLYPDLKSGRWIIVSGERADVAKTSGVVVSELVMLASATQDVGHVTIKDAAGDKPIPIPGDKLHTFLQFAQPLAYKYKRETVTIYGNVVRATHGETRSEALGSGDGSQALQRFPLHQSPLTYTSAPTPDGIESSLKVRVNDILWHEADSLADLQPTDRSYIIQTDDADKTSVIFGNGKHGARLPTGVENVKAVYRTGIGKPGNVKAWQISLLATRPLGVQGVINPLPATGGADREDRDQARRNVPLGVMAVDRLVSVQDYEDFARVFAGVGKASAARLSDGHRQLVHVSIAGAENIPIDPTSDLYRNLFQALHQFGDPHEPLQLAVCEVVLLVIIAKVHLLSDYLWESVEAQIRTAVLDAFSFDRRTLGQPIFQSEVISVMQAVTGVDYVDLERMDAVDQEKLVKALEAAHEEDTNPTDVIDSLIAKEPQDILVNLARYTPTKGDPTRILAAQLAFLSPDQPDTLILNPTGAS
jgi:Baseplate J-like protein